MKLIKKFLPRVKDQCLIGLLIVINLNHCSCVLHPDGRSTVSGYQDELGNYQFDYTISSNDGEHFHKAATDPLGRVVGSYGMTLSDGRRRMVDYVADKNGFRAHVRSNEPGIISAESAGASIEKIDSSIHSTFLPGNQRLELIAPDSDTDIPPNTPKDQLKYTASRVAYVRPDEDEEHKREHIDLMSDYEESDLEKNIGYREPLLKTDEELSLEGNKNFDADPLEKISEFDTDSEELPLTEIPELHLEKDQQENKVFLPSTYNPPINPKSISTPSNQFQRRRRPIDHAQYSDHSQPYPRSSTPYASRLNYRSQPSSNTDFDEYLKEYHSHSSPRLSYFDDHNNGYMFNVPSFFSDRDKALHPSLTMSTVHGGYTGGNSYNFPSNEDSYGVRNNGLPRRHPSTIPSNYQPTYGSTNFPFHFGDRLPVQPTRKPNIVLRTVAIPNGIQAVPVNTATGEIHDGKVFPVYDSKFNSHDSNYNYNPNVHSHVNERNFRNFPQFTNFRNRFPPAPVTSHTPSHLPNAFESPKILKQHPVVRKHTQPSLSKPSSKDLAIILRVNEHVRNQQSGISPNPHNYPRQRDPPPDYPLHGASHAKLSHQVEANEPKGHYPTSERPTPIRRPSLAVRLPVSDVQQNAKFGNREYRSIPRTTAARNFDSEVNSGRNSKNTNTPET